jgi:NAD(P)-dependent dehydrogenase (short-subunit alcohol dehydrogenase family)/uncharacterized protein YndB with AHSA1/START domain
VPANHVGLLSGENAVITGGGRGIGLAIATAFAREGASVALVARSADQLATASRTIADAGGVVITRRADVTDEAAMSAVIDDVRAVFGPITILVNNAGAIAPIAPFGESTLDDWWRCVEVNLRGPAVCTQLVIHEMAARGRGRIINLVSGAAITSFANFSAYVASKTAVARWSESLAAELAPYGVQVFAMEPGTVATAMSEFSVNSPEGRRWIPWFKGLFEAGLDSPMERVAQRALDLAAGKADGLSGRYIPLADSLDDLVANTARIREETLYLLRMSRLVQSPPSAALRALRASGEMALSSVVRLRRRLPISALEAFGLWRDGETVASWFLPPGMAEWLGPPTMEPHAGGRFSLELSSGGERFHIYGTVVAATPGQGLTLRWSWETDSPILGSAKDTSVTVEFVPARGGVDVVITHEGLPSETVRDAYIRGWRRCLDGMLRVTGSARQREDVR